MLRSLSNSVKLDTTNYLEKPSTQLSVKALKNRESESSNLLMSKPISEQNDWIRLELSKLWGDNQADYFVNPARLVNASEDPSKEEVNSSIKSIRKTTRNTGLFAYDIWDTIRDDSDNRLKTFDLDKELKATMDTFFRNDAIKSRKSRLSLQGSKSADFSTYNNEDDLLKQKYMADAERVNKAKTNRHEIELMYRSSKLNQERVNILRTNSPMPDLNDHEGKESIVRYLPPINLSEDSRAVKVNSSLEFISSPTMRRQFKKRLEKKLALQSESVPFHLIDTKTGVDSRSKKKALADAAQNVKLHFLTEKPARTYLSSCSKTESMDTRSLDHMQLVSRKCTPFALTDKEVQLKETSCTDSANSVVTYPPLSINALMEYKPSISVPGTGDFEHGKPKLFRLN